MTWGHVLAAADGSPAGLHALAVAGDLCKAAQLRLSAVTATKGPSGGAIGEEDPHHEYLLVRR